MAVPSTGEITAELGALVTDPTWRTSMVRELAARSEGMERDPEVPLYIPLTGFTSAGGVAVQAALVEFSGGALTDPHAHEEEGHEDGHVEFFAALLVGRATTFVRNEATGVFVPHALAAGDYVAPQKGAWHYTWVGARGLKAFMANVREQRVIKTERPGVVVREFFTPADDVARFEAIASSRSHLGVFGNGVTAMYPTLVDVVRTRVENDGSRIGMGVWDDTVDRLVAGVDITTTQEDDTVTEAELGFWTRADAVRRGYATLAIQAAVAEFAPRVPRLFAEVRADNLPSIAVMEGTGCFQREPKTVKRDWAEGRRVVVFNATT